MLNGGVLYFDVNNATSDDATNLKHNLCYFMDPNYCRCGYNVIIAHKNLLSIIDKMNDTELQIIKSINHCIIYALQCTRDKQIYFDLDKLTSINTNVENLLDMVLFSAVSCRYNILISSLDFDNIYKTSNIAEGYKEKYPELNFYFKIPITNELIKLLYRDRDLLTQLCENVHIKPMFVFVDNTLKREGIPSFVRFIEKNSDILTIDMFSDYMQNIYTNNKDQIIKTSQDIITYQDSLVCPYNDVQNILSNR